MRAVAAGVTDVGKERDHNEDRFVLLPEFEVFVVADGMGGHQCGEVASRMATSTIAGFFRDRRVVAGDSTEDVLRASVMEANDRIHHRAAHSPVHRGMGTTVVAVAFNRSDQTLYVAHAGDSRCYRLRDGAFSQITRDHSLIEEALRTRPDITKSELAYLPSNVITRALGVEANVDVELSSDPVRIGDVYLLCSDGLHGFVGDDRIRDIIDGTAVLTTACGELIAEANKNGGGDNITAVLVRIEEADDPWRVATSVPPAPARTPTEPPLAAAPVPVVDGAPVVGVGAPGEADDTERTRPLSAAEAVALLEADDTAKMPALTDLDAGGFDPGVGDSDDDDPEPTFDVAELSEPPLESEPSGDSGPPPAHDTRGERHADERESVPPPSAP